MQESVSIKLIKAGADPGQTWWAVNGVYFLIFIAYYM